MDMVVDQGDPVERLVDIGVRPVADPTALHVPDPRGYGTSARTRAGLPDPSDEVEDAHEDPRADRRQGGEVLEALPGATRRADG